jgi:hypothetical protein
VKSINRSISDGATQISLIKTPVHAHTLTDKRYEYGFPLLITNGVTGVREMENNLPIEEVNQIRKDVKMEIV